MDLEKSNLNRSRSEPYFRKVVILEEHYQHEYRNNPLIRQVTYSEIYGSLPDISSNSLVMEEVLSSPNSSRQQYSRQQSPKSRSQFENARANSPFIWQNQNHDWRQGLVSEDINYRSSVKKDAEFEESPMEVDYSKEDDSDDASSRELSKLSDRCKPHKRNIRNLNKPVHQPKCGTFSNYVWLSIIIVIIALLVGVLYSAIVNENKTDFRMCTALNSILSQDRVKEVTLHSLSKLNEDSHYREVLVYVGTTGVGKTYTINLLKTCFTKEYIIDVNFNMKPNLKVPLLPKECYLVTIDNLKIDNLKDIISYVGELPDRCMLVIPVFNIHDVNDDLVYTVNESSFKTIKDEFTMKFSSNVEILQFNNITRNTLEKWVSDKIDVGALKEQEVLSVLNEHQVEIYGFKGLMRKLELLHKK